MSIPVKWRIQSGICRVAPKQQSLNWCGGGGRRIFCVCRGGCGYSLAGRRTMSWNGVSGAAVGQQRRELRERRDEDPAFAERLQSTEKRLRAAVSS